jgi:hypothetical protein
MQIITKHTRYTVMLQERQGEYQAFVELKAVRSNLLLTPSRLEAKAIPLLRQMLNDAAAVNQKVVAWLEDRESKWVASNGTTGTASTSREQTSTADFTRSRSSTTGTKDSQDSVGDLIDGYGSAS